MVIAWAMIIIIVCITGSLSTGTGPIEFLFLAMAGIVLGGVALFLLIGLGFVFFFAIFKNRVDDDRPLFAALSEDFGPKRLAREYGVLFRNLSEYVKDVKDNLRTHYGQHYGRHDGTPPSEKDE